MRQIVAKGDSRIKRKVREGKDSTKEETAQKEQRDSEMWGEIKLGMSNRVESVDKSRIGGYSGITQKERKMIPMKEIQEAIMWMGGHQGRECYWLLCLAVYEARERWPERPQMKEIWVAVQQKAHKRTATAVSKGLERAVADLWKRGDRERMGIYQRSWEYEAPSPKEFIYVVAECLRERQREEAASKVT